MNRSIQQGSSGNHSQGDSVWQDCETMPIGTLMASAKVAATSKPDFSNEQIGWLVHAVEHDIIPRLLRSAKGASEPHDFSDAQLQTAVDHIVQLVLENRDDTALVFVRSLEKEGLSLDSIFLNVLAPAARTLGVMWENDTCDFTQVTLGMWRLHQVMHDLSAAFQHHSQGPDYQQSLGNQSRQALLVPVPGSQHSLGLLMVVEFFRRDGWTVCGDPTLTLAELIKNVKRQHFDVIGISVGTEEEASLVAKTIQAVRASSRNQAIKVMIGGPYVLANPKAVQEMHADASAPDARLAVQVANQMTTACG
jgi:MerR family transcriptional regulator, light-induced transcriptional regulator